MTYGINDYSLSMLFHLAMGFLCVSPLLQHDTSSLEGQVLLSYQRIRTYDVRVITKTALLDISRVTNGISMIHVPDNHQSQNTISDYKLEKKTNTDPWYYRGVIRFLGTNKHYGNMGKWYSRIPPYI
jgi:hypothetical protein